MTKLKDKPFALVGVHVGGSTVTDLKDITVRMNIPWRSFVDLGNAGAGRIAKAWNHMATPTMYLLDGQGKIRYKWVGTPGEAALDRAIERLMTETEQKR